MNKHLHLSRVDICDEIRPRRTYIINGKAEKIVRLIPMQNQESQIYDVEILLDKAKNRYFSWNMFIKGESWVKDIYSIEK